MKKFIFVSLFTLISIIIFILIDTGYIFQEQQVTKDEEQKGLDNQIVIRFSHVVAENTPKGLAAQKFSELVYEKTDGRVKVQVYPNGILYSDREELSALRKGEIEMIAPSYTNITKLIPQWKVLDLPFLLEDYSHVKTVLTGDIGSGLLSLLDEKQMKGMAFWSNGFKQMTSNRHPLLKPEDFEGQTFRTMPGPVLQSQFRLLGAKPITTSFTDIYNVLEKNEVNGQENTISNIYSKGLYQFQPYITVSNHGFLGYAVIVNKKFWDSLPADIQQEISEAMKETTMWNMKQSAEMNQKQLQELKNMKGVTIYDLPPKDKKEWIKRFEPLYIEIENQIGPDLLNEIRKKQQ